RTQDPAQATRRPHQDEVTLAAVLPGFRRGCPIVGCVVTDLGGCCQQPPPGSTAGTLDRGLPD
ncbi:MAG: hypothetical protein ACKOJF_08045, partial [Planctomycetaceae bacterium]